MGQGHSGGEEGKGAVAQEIEYLAEHTSLKQEQLKEIYEKYFTENKISKKDFLQEFTATFPK